MALIIQLVGNGIEKAASPQHAEVIALLSSVDPTITLSFRCTGRLESDPKWSERRSEPVRANAEE